jgi:hypothetical protein
MTGMDWDDLIKTADSVLEPASPLHAVPNSYPSYDYEEDDRSRRYLNKSVCLGCLTEPALRDVVSYWIDQSEPDVSAEGTCAYCHASSAVASVDDVFDFIVRQIGTQFAPAEEEWNPTLDESDFHSSFDILSELDSQPFEHEALFDDFAAAFPDHQWTLRDVMEDRRRNSLTRGWQVFTEHVKHAERFMFFNPSNEIGSYHPDDIPIDQMLHELGRVFERAELVRLVPERHSLMRARLSDDGERFSGGDLFPPKPENTKHSRMSPRGIAMFYGASDVPTTLSELRYDPVRHTGSVGRFETTRPLVCLDLGHFPGYLSIFDPEIAPHYDEFVFAKRFINDVTLPVRDEDPLEYVPTQIVTEYVRRVFRQRSVDAIRFPSSLRSKDSPPYAGLCWTFFPSEDGSFPLQFMETLEVEI